MFCNNCGKEISDQAAACIHCGVSTGKVSFGELDGPVGGLGVVCFLFPVVGLILYLVWKDIKPIKAKGSGKWALWGFGIGVVINILYFLILIFVVPDSGFGSGIY